MSGIMETEPKCKTSDSFDAECDRENVGPQYKRGSLYSTDTSSVDANTQFGAAKKANTRLEYLSELDICRKQQEMSPMRNTGIVCTIGPACLDLSEGVVDVEILTKLMKEGLSVARIDLSHHTPLDENCSHCQDEEEKKIVTTIKSIRNAKKDVAIALDTKGREIRTGFLEKDRVPKCERSQEKPRKEQAVEVKVTTGQRLNLSTDEQHQYRGNQSTIYVDYKNITNIGFKEGDLVYLNDGLIALKVIGIDPTHLSTEVQNGGVITKRRGVNLPGKKVDLPVLTELDKQFLKLGVEHNVDMVFASFIQTKEDVEAIREVLGRNGSHILVISKIENEVGLCNFDEILRASDGIMVARGDLGIEIPPEKVFIAQKMMISRCNRAGKPVIVATQMLHTMKENPRPTRAEVSDVANAVLDGADCVMLVGETAKGKYPVEAVATMSKIALEAEAVVFHRSVFDEMCKLTPTPTNTVQTTAIAAVNAAFQQHAAAIITVTISGKTAFILSQYCPPCPIIAVTRNSFVARICHLYRNVYPMLYEDSLTQEEWLEDMEEKLKAGVKKGMQEGFIKKESIVVLLSGWIPGPDHINTIRITTAEEATR